MCNQVVKQDIISFVNPYRTPSVFPCPEKKDGEVPLDITSVGGDPFPPLKKEKTVIPLTSRIREYELFRDGDESSLNGSSVGRSGR